MEVTETMTWIIPYLLGSSVLGGVIVAVINHFSNSKLKEKANSHDREMQELRNRHDAEMKEKDMQHKQEIEMANQSTKEHMRISNLIDAYFIAAGKYFSQDEEVFRDLDIDHNFYSAHAALLPYLHGNSSLILRSIMEHCTGNNYNAEVGMSNLAALGSEINKKN